MSAIGTKRTFLFAPPTFSGPLQQLLCYLVAKKRRQFLGDLRSLAIEPGFLHGCEPYFASLPPAPSGANAKLPLALTSEFNDALLCVHERVHGALG